MTPHQTAGGARLRTRRPADRGIVVDNVPVDRQGKATVRVDDGERAILAVIGTTPAAAEPATYRYALDDPQ